MRNSIMFRCGIRLAIEGCKTFKNKNTLCSNPLFLRLTQSLAQVTDSDNGINVETPNTQIVKLVKSSLKNLGFQENDIKVVIKNQPELLNQSPYVWNSILSTLLQFGIAKDTVLTILQKWPQVLSLKTNDLENKLAAWFRCNLGEKLTLSILEEHPYLLQVPHTIVEKRIKQYQIMFESKRRVGKMLLIAPNTLNEDLDQLVDKLNYLDDLCTDKSDVVSSGVLAHSALHVKTRHEFLIRAGVYKRPPKDFIKRLNKNPSLTSIVNTSDKEFVSKVARLSLIEYEVFSEMFEKELKESKEEELGSEEDEELNQLSYGKRPN